MTKAEKDFMERTIKAHCLSPISLKEARSFLPARAEENYFEACRLAATTDYFERSDCIVSDGNDYPIYELLKKSLGYMTPESLKKSFDKWLAIQKHDVKAVNSLHEWAKALELAELELGEDIYDLEQMALSPALRIHVDKVLARKEAEHEQLMLLRHRIGFVIDQIKSAPISRKAIVA